MKREIKLKKNYHISFPFLIPPNLVTKDWQKLYSLLHRAAEWQRRHRTRSRILQFKQLQKIIMLLLMTAWEDCFTQIEIYLQETNLRLAPTK